MGFKWSAVSHLHTVHTEVICLVKLRLVVRSRCGRRRGFFSLFSISTVSRVHEANSLHVAEVWTHKGQGAGSSVRCKTRGHPRCVRLSTSATKITNVANTSEVSYGCGLKGRTRVLRGLIVTLTFAISRSSSGILARAQLRILSASSHS